MTGTGSGVAHEGELREDQGKAKNEHGPCSWVVIETLARPFSTFWACLLGSHGSGASPPSNRVNSNKRPGKIQSEIWINADLGKVDHRSNPNLDRLLSMPTYKLRSPPAFPPQRLRPLLPSLPLLFLPLPPTRADATFPIAR